MTEAHAQRLSKAKTIAHLRERRSERARLEATRELVLSERAAARAQAEEECRERAGADASDMFFADPADPNRAIWRTVTARHLDTAKQASEAALRQRAESAELAALARRAHEQASERVAILDREIATGRRAYRSAQDDRMEEETQEQRG